MPRKLKKSILVLKKWDLAKFIIILNAKCSVYIKKISN